MVTRRVVRHETRLPPPPPNQLTHPPVTRVFQRARLAHTRGVQRESYKQMKLGQLTSAAGVWVREFAIRNIPPGVLQKKLRAANVFDVDPWLKRFRALKAKTTRYSDGVSRVRQSMK